MKTLFTRLAAAAVLAMSASAHATPSPYSQPGVENRTSYTFTAASAGNINAYFAGSTAAYTNELTLLINGVQTGIYGLNTRTSAYGASMTSAP